jgi:hypothetical protein
MTATDSWTEASRHLRIIPRNPELLIFATIQPIMFVVPFVYVFGGSITVPGYELRAVLDSWHLQPVAGVRFGLHRDRPSEDLSKGLIDRLRSLPMARSAVLIGRTVSDLVRNVITFTHARVSFWPIGFRFEGTIERRCWPRPCCLCSATLSWVQALMGLSVARSRRLTRPGSSGCSPYFHLVGVRRHVDAARWLQPIAEWNPFTKVTNAARALYNGLPPGDALWQSIAWSVGLIAVFSALSIRKFNRSTVA